MKVLAIGAHPDDIEIACAGTLAKCVKRGDEVYVCFLCSGNLGHVIIPPSELRVMRYNEAKRAAALAGVQDVFYGGCDDLDIFSESKETRDNVVEVIRKVNPDFIITHLLYGYTGRCEFRAHRVRRHRGRDWTCSKYRGYQCGASYAEGFRQCNVYLKNTTKRYLP